LNFVKRVIRLVKIKLKNRKPPPDPLTVLQGELQQMDDKLQEIKRSSLELGKSRIQLDHRVRDLQKTINSYQDQARKALKLGREDLAELALRNKNSARETQDQLQHKIDRLGEQIQELERAKEMLINEITIYKIKRDEMELTRKAAQAELSVQERRWGVAAQESANDIQEAFRRLEGEINEIQAEVEATRELGEPADPALPESEPEKERSPAITKELEELKRELNPPSSSS